MMKLASIFTNSMVLQQKMPIRIFGEGDGVATVTFLGETKSVTSQNHTWCISLSPREAGGPYELMVQLNEQTIVLTDILIGEVWIAAGQSNMEMPVFRTETGIEDAHNYQNSQIRFFCVPRRMKKDRANLDWHFGIMKEEDYPWQPCHEASSLTFSALGYYTAKELYQSLNVPIGIISLNWGGRKIEPFISRDYCDTCEPLKKIKEDFENIVTHINAKEYEKTLEDVIKGKNAYFTNEVGDALTLVKRIGIRAARECPDYRKAPMMPTGIYDTVSIGTLWDSMVSRIVPYGVKGMLWYQGESNGEEKDYLPKFQTLLECWRTEFQNPLMPIYAVELASYWDWESISYLDLSAGRFVTDRNWAFLREQQMAAAQWPESYLVTTQEIGDPFDIHPVNKKALAHRMALKMLCHTYQKDLEADNPTYQSVTFQDGKAFLHFDHAAGLFAFELGSVHMLIGGKDHQLYPASLTIEGETIIAQSEQVLEPSVVRYGFDYAYFGSHIYNQAGLPLSPFRTDRD